MTEKEGYPDQEEPAASELLIMQGRNEEKERVIQEIETDFPEKAEKILSSLYHGYTGDAKQTPDGGDSSE